eukprot:TRINITY_DN11023_c0_g2_i1.p1 TRINITY_DN11023_c0_g2~~TRINITY_DN11023_c0_g2_i1.p1  ORF type:complete len:119 (+),score=27.57 TRINITY_DN11023_c0_g2_i1:487-843(+)
MKSSNNNILYWRRQYKTDPPACFHCVELEGDGEKVRGTERWRARGTERDRGKTRGKERESETAEKVTCLVLEGDGERVQLKKQERWREGKRSREMDKKRDRERQNEGEREGGRVEKVT